MVRENAKIGPPLLTLTTDFGSADPYVAMMKGVILGRVPGATFVDITHEVQPGGFVEAAFALERAWRYFPDGAVHVVVVDPGVGTSRARLALAAGGHFFLGPDNGCLSCALPEGVRGARPPAGVYAPRRVALSDDLACVAIEALDVLAAGGPSATFEGRDVFAPAAAFMASGGALRALGAPVRDLLALPQFRAPGAGSRMQGLVLQADRFGNLITDIRASDLPPSPVFLIGSRRLEGLSHTYATASGIAAITGSSGFVEIARPGGNAAEELALGAGATVSVEPG